MIGMARAGHGIVVQAMATLIDRYEWLDLLNACAPASVLESSQQFDAR